MRIAAAFRVVLVRVALVRVVLVRVVLVRVILVRVAAFECLQPVRRGDEGGVAACVGTHDSEQRLLQPVAVDDHHVRLRDIARDGRGGLPRVEIDTEGNQRADVCILTGDTPRELRKERRRCDHPQSSVIGVIGGRTGRREEERGDREDQGEAES